MEARIRIDIKVKGRIRIRIRVSEEDPDQLDKQYPDPDQCDADPQHCSKGNDLHPQGLLFPGRLENVLDTFTGRKMDSGNARMFICKKEISLLWQG